MHQAALLWALVDADAFEMSLEQMQQLDELEAADDESATHLVEIPIQEVTVSRLLLLPSWSATLCDLECRLSGLQMQDGMHLSARRRLRVRFPTHKTLHAVSQSVPDSTGQQAQLLSSLHLIC